MDVGTDEDESAEYGRTGGVRGTVDSAFTCTLHESVDLDGAGAAYCAQPTYVCRTILMPFPCLRS